MIAANTVYFRTLTNVKLSGKQIFTVFIKQSSSFATFVDLLAFSESLSSSNFSISCWVDEANREAMFLLQLDIALGNHALRAQSTDYSLICQRISE